jgi:hypothetical protein
MVLQFVHSPPQTALQILRTSSHGFLARRGHLRKHTNTQCIKKQEKHVQLSVAASIGRRDFPELSRDRHDDCKRLSNINSNRLRISNRPIKESKMKNLAAFAIMFAAVAILGTALTRAASDENPSSSDSVSSKASAKSTMPCCHAKSVEANEDIVATGKSACCDKGDCAKCAATKPAAQAASASIKKCEFCTDENCKQECTSCAEARKESAAADSESAAAHRPGKGMGRRQGMGHGHAGDSQHDKDHQDFFFLIEHRDSIRRTVKNIPNGIESLTESDVAEVADMIQVHVEAMYDRVENGNPIRMRDPIFRAIFANADKIKMNVEHTEHGVRVTETSTDAYVVKLLQEHAKVVSLWIKNGYAELPKNHAAPPK